MIESPVYDMIKEEGLEQGIEKGEKRGIEKGEKHKALDAARRMKKKGYPIEDIADITGLSTEEIEQL